ncbi:MAG: PQQ-dependent sugar dehydrogenase [Proteobacteria bacterium]|nr:PQQ-dependent sugar dehydrogenase [Pseudomonadota bacterium]
MRIWFYIIAVSSAVVAGSVLPACSKDEKSNNVSEQSVRKAGAPPRPASEARTAPHQAPAARSAKPAADQRKGSVNQPDKIAPPATAAELSRALTVPAGFQVEVFTDQVPNARAMVLSQSGTLFVGSNRVGRVYAVVDQNGDHRPDRVHIVAEGLTMPVGLDLHKGALYVSSLDRVVRLDNIESRLDSPPKPVVVSDRFPGDMHHGWKFIRFGPDGWLYVPVGAPCNICLMKDPRYASIMRMRPDGSELEVYAHGVRNTVGFDWHPDTGQLWFTDNGRDWLGDDAPSDELNRATEKGQHFGYPFCHAGTISDPEYGVQRACGEFVPPARKLGPHVAGLGMRFYTGKQFPESYRGAIFIAEHGSWNRAQPIGYRVTVVKMGPDGAPASYQPFVEGWLQANGAWGRPVDVLVHPDGSLLVSDDRAGRIYRVSYRGS